MSEELQRNQLCGCVICVCDDGEQCHGCGAKSCGTHPAGEIPNPVYIPMMPLPPPDVQAMTREMVLKIADKVFKHYPFKHELNYWLAHEAGQRETIRRLEQQIEMLKGCLEENRKHAAQLQARLTASEAKHKWTNKPPTKEGFYWLRAPKHGWRDAVVWIEKDGDGPESYFYMPDDDSTPVDEVDGSWQGPLTPGEE